MQTKRGPVLLGLVHGPFVNDVVHPENGGESGILDPRIADDGSPVRGRVGHSGDIRAEFAHGCQIVNISSVFIEGADASQIGSFAEIIIADEFIVGKRIDSVEVFQHTAQLSPQPSAEVGAALQTDVIRDRRPVEPVDVFHSAGRCFIVIENGIPEIRNEAFFQPLGNVRSLIDAGFASDWTCGDNPRWRLHTG